MIYLSVLSFIASVLYFYTGYSAYRLNKSSQLCRLFLLLTLSMTVWSFSWGFLYLAENEVEYSLWNKVSAFGWCFFEALALYFTMILTENKWIKHRNIKWLIFMPAFLFLYMVLFLFGPDIDTSPIVERIFYTGNFLYNFLYLLISMVLLFLWGKKSKSLIQKRQSQIIGICSIIPFLLTHIIQHVLPAFHVLDLPDMGQIYTLIMLLGVHYAITNYQFMSIPTSLITKELFNELTGLTFLIDPQGFIIKANKQVAELLGYSAAEAAGKHINTIINHKELCITMECADRVSTLVKLENIMISTRTGIEIPFHFSIIPLRSKKDLLLGFLVIGEDIRSTKQLQDEIVKHKLTNEKLKNSEELFRTILEIAPISVILTSKKTGRMKYLNTRASELFQGEVTELIGSDITEYLMSQEDKELFVDTMKSGKEISQKEITLKRRDGTWFKGLLTMIPSIYHEEEIALTCIIDMTEQKRVEETLKQHNENIKKLNNELVIMNKILVNRSIKDSLTNLFNCQYMKEVLETSIQQAASTMEDLSVMMLDIDCFKQVNDHYGHQVGDRVLVTVSDLIMKNTRGSDYIGRYGGEEFIAVLPGTGLEDAAQISDRIRIAIQNYDFGLDDLKVTISIGVARYTGGSADEVIKQADMLLYQAKKSGKNRVVF